MPTGCPYHVGMSAAEYHALKQYLTAPPVRVIDDWPEFVHPHTPPDDSIAQPDGHYVADIEALGLPPTVARACARTWIRRASDGPEIPWETVGERGYCECEDCEYDHDLCSRGFAYGISREADHIEGLFRPAAYDRQWWRECLCGPLCRADALTADIHDAELLGWRRRTRDEPWQPTTTP